MDLHKAEWRLALVWLGAAGLLLLVLVGQSLAGFYQDRVDEAWAWFLPTIMPTLSLIVGVLAAEGLMRERKPRRIDPRLVHLATGLSVAYLLLVATSVIAAALVAHKHPPLVILNRSDLWLGPVQGLVAATLGVIFRRSESAVAAEPAGE